MITKSGVDLSVCAYCNEQIDSFSRTTDHLYPKSRGGILSNSNKVPACGKCNKLKGNMDIVEFQRALHSMIYLEHQEHKRKLGYLKKVKKNVEQLVEKHGRKQKHSVRHSTPRSRKSTKEKKKRP